MKTLFVLFSLIISTSTFTKTNVILETSSGTIELELFDKKAPESVKNFTQYVSDKFYDGTIFHRVINGFMIQGGGFSDQLVKKKTRKPIKNEASNGLSNEAGTIAMARTSDPNSATAQFFINVGENSNLNYKSPTPGNFGYAVFGRVIKGMSVVNKIKMVGTKSNGPFQNLPIENIIIKKAYLKK